MSKWIYQFSDIKFNDELPHSLANNLDKLKDLFGSKGIGLAQMYSQGIDVPPGFTITTEMHNYYVQNSYTLPKSFYLNLDNAIIDLENQTQKKFGDCYQPLLVAVRSGSTISMPGIMDTVLNLGINDKIALGLIDSTGNELFVLDTYLRFIKSYGHIVMGVPLAKFNGAIDCLKKINNVDHVRSLKIKDLRQLISEFKTIILEETKKELPQDIKIQLHSAIKAILKSWSNERAITYRKLNNITEDLGTAVNIQAMVFGNMDNNSATGVVFTRNPLTGDNNLYGEFLINAQGEDIVSGLVTPYLIDDNQTGKGTLKHKMPNMYAELLNYCQQIEKYYREAQDIEFTIEQGKLYILQTRSAKCTSIAAIKIAVDMVESGLISTEEAIMRIDPHSLNQLLHPHIVSTNQAAVAARGFPSAPGAVTGVIALSTDAAKKLAKKDKVILIRSDTTTEDIKAMHIASGIITTCGGTTSHAAIISRSMGKPCICGVKNIIIDLAQKKVNIGAFSLTEGTKITMDGNSGNIFLGQMNLVQPSFSSEFQTLMSWVDKINKMEIKANAETSTEINIAISLGATGVGLCRTEHMLLEHGKINLIQEVILADNIDHRKHALARLFPLHKADFKTLFHAAKSIPINIRLLDAPLHEFLPEKFIPQNHTDIIENLNISAAELNSRINTLKENNPMLGNRGCRIAITYPEIYEMQIQALFEAAIEVSQKLNITPKIEITVPLISDSRELIIIKEMVHKIAKHVRSAHLMNNQPLKYKVGAMIELPRAALQAHNIAKEADFFCFGTNDLTQTSYGISRDDIESFLDKYMECNIFPADPFLTIDQEGVGELINNAIQRGTKANASLKTEVCGEHAADPNSISFFHKIKVDTISCSVYRIPIAKIAAAQSAIYAKYMNSNHDKKLV